VLAQVGLGFLQGISGSLAGFVSIVGLALAFYPLYYFLPMDDVTLREAIPGAVFAAIGWTVLQTGFRIYAAQAGGSAYGVIGAALLILTFLYFGGMILLIGVAINAVLAGRTGKGSGVEAASEGEEGGEREGGEEHAGETNTEEGVFRDRVKERTQSIIDERDGEADVDGEANRDDERATTDGGRTLDDDRLVTDGGVEHERTSASESGAETETGTEAERESASGAGSEPAGSTTTAAATGPETATDTADAAESARTEAATATGMDGTEHTLSEEYALQREIERLRTELDAFEMEVEERVVDRDDLESDLEDYVKSRVRSGKARGWGPYLVLLYGTAMTIAIALGEALTGGWALAAILVIFLSTLGLYVLMVLVGLGLSTVTSSKKVLDFVQSRRS
jgi:hypothetical protein